VHERRGGATAALYPQGIHGTLAHALRRHLGDTAEIHTATLDEPHHGLPVDLLDKADVLLWWGHEAHDQVPDELARRIQQRVLDGMGFIVLHSGHLSKPFRLLMGTSCTLRWREGEDREHIWTVNPTHPIAAGVPGIISLDRDEMYGEYFDIPTPDQLVFVSSFSGGEIIRGGCCFLRGKGKIFYFSPGHETYPIYHDPAIQQVVANAVGWAHRGNAPSDVSTGLIESPTGWFERDS
jgi:trehalose utilization protein